MRVLVVIPAFNEEQALTELLVELREARRTGHSTRVFEQRATREPAQSGSIDGR